MTATTQPVEFDLCGPLPEGVTVLEASAGTGKTYTVAALTARYVADGIPLERLLLITFTRMATGELRDRVRERLVHTEHELSRILMGAPDPRTDPIVTLLASGSSVEVELRRDRLARAVADFDAATIATTHGFCQEMLAELGTVGDLEPGTAFVEDVSDLVEEALDDLYVRGFRAGGRDPLGRAQALKVARAAVFNPGAELQPDAEPRESRAGIRYRIAVAVRAEVERRKRLLAVMTYDDLLTRLNDTLATPGGEAARARLRSRYDVVLVDEFQDTDPIQWQILHRAFAADGVTLVLIADPKQAIYAFRGADVYAYLVAAQKAAARATLPINRRSDQPLLDAYDALFSGARLGHEGIVYRQTRAAPGHETSRLIGAPMGDALRARIVHRSEPTLELTFNGYIAASSARAHIARDLAADVVALLSSGAHIEHRTPDGVTASRQDLRPRHIAVLVRTHANADLVRDELHAARVPAVINGAGSVFATPAARDWLRLLEALEQPSSALRARTAALTPFLGWSAQRVATAPEAELEVLHRHLHGWSRILRDSGVAALAEAIMRREGLPGRLLGVSDGERRLTDLRHLAQLLHRAASAEHLGVTALRGWLAQRVAEAARDEGEEERARRIDSDAEAVQVLTIHRSKGLEFPIVYCPFLWDPTYIPADEPVAFHDPAAGNRYMLDVGGDEHRSFRAHARQHLAEQRGEDLRLAYVALTRAKHQAVIWWAGSRDTRNGPLTRLLFSRQENGNIPPEGGSTPTDSAADRRFATLAADAPGRISVERSSLERPTAWSPPLPPSTELLAETFKRRLDLRWRRTSYSDITAEAHDLLVATEPEERVLTDEPDATLPVPVPVPAAAGEAAEPLAPGLEAPSLWGALPAGIEFGTFVHRVFEAVDFAAEDLDAELGERLAALGSRRSLGSAGAAEVVAALRATIATPLGGVAARMRLRDLTRGDRLDELAFELPLVGGDDPSGRLTLAAIAATLRGRLPDGDPMAAYAARLEDPALRSSVRGFLTGSIDLVLRLPGPRFVIADYKTNWLGPFDTPLTVGRYRPAALAEEMSHAHYGLQALLYAVALHRYLRWRLPGYSCERHLAGVLYLFVRGMAGADTPVVGGVPCGVFEWRSAASVVEALSDVLDRGKE